MSDPPPAPPPGVLGRAARTGWLLLGFVLVGIGLIGAVVPLLPTTIFLILAAGCFARSSPRLEAWLLDHPRFGPGLRAWRTERAISRPAKRAACLGIALGYAIFYLTARPEPGTAIVVGAMLAACALWIATRKEPDNGP